MPDNNRNTRYTNCVVVVVVVADISRAEYPRSVKPGGMLQIICRAITLLETLKKLRPAYVRKFDSC